jgi:hypothetical protein
VLSSSQSQAVVPGHPVIVGFTHGVLEAFLNRTWQGVPIADLADALSRLLWPRPPHRVAVSDLGILQRIKTDEDYQGYFGTSPSGP